MNGPVHRVALTGGIATGKSYCLAKFAALGVPTIDADTLAHQAVAPGTPGLAGVVTRFGNSVLKSDGSLDRATLGKLVFADVAARRDLEAIIHPVVYVAIAQWFAGQGQDVSLAVADIPLLFETGREREFDRVVVAACRPEQQLDRLLARGGLTDVEARQRIAAQLPLAEKVRRASDVIDTSGTLADTDRQVAELVRKISSAPARP